MTPELEPTAAIAALPALTPFVGPEALARASGGAALVRLGANESAFGVAPGVRAAMAQAAAEISWYGDPENRELRESLAALHGTSPEAISVGAGIDDVLGTALRAYAADRTVVTTAGTYPTLFYHLAGYGARAVTAPYGSDGSVPLADLARLARTAGARVVYLANPDNPSGTFAERGAVEAFVASLPPDALVILDEAYADFVDASELPALAGDRRVVRLRTFSKAHGLAGARVGYALASPDVVSVFEKIRLHFGVNRIAQAAALAALGDREFVAGVVAEVARGRAHYAAIAERLGLGVLPSRTNFVCLDLGTRARAEATVGEMLRRGIFIRKPGTAPLDRYVRVTVGTEVQREGFATALAGALDALAEKRAVS